MTCVARGDVATALGVASDALPPGDLPLDRLATLYARYAAQAAREEEAPDLFWTFELMDWLATHRPDTAWEVLRATLDHCTRAEEVAFLAAGPAEDLIRTHGPALIDRIATSAAHSARVRFLLSGVWQGDTPPLLWARIVSARAPGPALDDGAPLPPPDAGR